MTDDKQIDQIIESFAQDYETVEKWFEAWWMSMGPPRYLDALNKHLQLGVEQTDNMPFNMNAIIDAMKKKFGEEATMFLLNHYCWSRSYPKRPGE
jgi:hypothetical protein